jgi:4-hydroxy-3-methylbut-2-en-1-yl diphosphate synthase IspG/GcpE
VTFAALGQGRADGKLTPEEESAVITKLLTYWALQSTLFVTAGCPDCGLSMSTVPHVHDDNANTLKGPSYVRT